MKKIITTTIVFVLALSCHVQAETQFIKYKNYLIPLNNVDEGFCDENQKPKLIVSTDYGDWNFTEFGRSGGLGSPGGDAGEAAAMTHFLAYSNEFDVRGIIASTTIGTGEVAEINNHLGYYQEDYADFGWQNRGFQSSFVVKEGVQASNGVLPDYYDSASMNNEATQLIVSEAQAATANCPVNIVVWGGILEVTSALYYLHTNDPSSVANIRVVANGSANVEGFSLTWAWNDLYLYAEPDTYYQFNNLAHNLVARGCNYPTDSNQIVYGNTTSEEFMDAITGWGSDKTTVPVYDNFPESLNPRGMRDYLQAARYWINGNHCNFPDIPVVNSMKSGDSLTLYYFLDLYHDFYGGVVVAYVEDNANYINDENDLITDSMKTVIYEHYINRMNELYN